MLTEETRLPKILGLKSRNRLRALRQQLLREGEDWVFEKKRVCYTLAGVEKIRAHLRLSGETTAPPTCSAQPGPAIAPLPEPETLLVWNCRLVNKKMLLAYKPDTDPHDAKNILRVRVRSSENFVRFVHGEPMKLRARHVQADLYELVGPCPRRKGWIPPQ